MTVIDHRDIDRQIWENELEEFVPRRLYDMHVHMWSEAHAGDAEASGLRREIDYRDHLAWAEALYPGREIHYLVLATPIVGMDAHGHNEWMAAEMAADPRSGVNMMVTPAMSPEYVDAMVERHGFVGLKPYRTFAPDPAEAAIRDFLPEALIEVAHQRGLAVTMHLSKRAGPADFENLADLERYTRVYPGVRWILAHCARGFNAVFLEEAIHFLKGLPGIWYDTSAVNDVYAHYLLMKHEDRRRVMYGSDNVVAGCARGKVRDLRRRLALPRRRPRPAPLRPGGDVGDLRAVAPGTAGGGDAGADEIRDRGPLLGERRALLPGAGPPLTAAGGITRLRVGPRPEPAGAAAGPGGVVGRGVLERLNPADPRGPERLKPAAGPPGYSDDRGESGGCIRRGYSEREGDSCASGPSSGAGASSSCPPRRARSKAASASRRAAADSRMRWRSSRTPCSVASSAPRPSSRRR